jgi:hypothetical protein
MKIYVSPDYASFEIKSKDVITSSKDTLNVNCSQTPGEDEQGNVISNVIANVSSIFKG